MANQAPVLNGCLARLGPSGSNFGFPLATRQSNPSGPVGFPLTGANKPTFARAIRHLQRLDTLFDGLTPLSTARFRHFR